MTIVGTIHTHHVAGSLHCDKLEPINIIFCHIASNLPDIHGHKVSTLHQ